VKKTKVLIACEESQAVCIEFRKLGFEAYSCDIQECSGGYPEWHLQMDVFEAIDLIKPGLMIGFPPCTDLANAGGSWFERKRKNGSQKKSIEFFFKLLSSPVEFIALENPVGILCSNYINVHFPELLPELKKVNLPRKPDQVIQPFYFGDPVRKYTCLWLKNLPPLVWTENDDMFTKSNYVKPIEPIGDYVRKGKYRTGTKRKKYWQDMLPKKDRAKIKSKTFPGIAKAMAEQWSDFLINKQTI